MRPTGAVMRKLTAALFAVGIGLSACSSGAAGDVSEQQAAPAATPSASPQRSDLALEAGRLYEEYAQELRDLGAACSSFETDLVTTCRLQLARAKDILDD